VAEAVKSERLAILQARIEEQRQAFNRACIGRTVEVLVERKGRHAGQMAGKSPWLQAVQFGDEGFPADCHIGDMVSVEITDISTNSLFGRPVSVKAAA
jgi:tRNA-2-methylthio-N6-dimethylallyladenosine synthase